MIYHKKKIEEEIERSAITRVKSPAISQYQPYSLTALLTKEKNTDQELGNIIIERKMRK
jgi:hypothetical protein